MAYTWNSTLETGHPLIDSQHKELIKTINELLDACYQGQAADHVAKTLNFLIDYTKRHFHDEEGLQQQSHYPDYPNHRKLHEDFVKSIAGLAEELKQSGPTPSLVNKIISGVGNWLVQHIMQQDVRVAAHIKNTVK